MNAQGDMTGLLAAHVVVASAFVGWLIVGRAPAILHAPLSSGCAFLNGIVTLAGLYILLNATTTVEQIAGFCAVLLGAAGAVGEYGVSLHNFAVFRVPSTRTMTAKVDAAKPHAAKLGRAKRVRAKTRRPKKVG
jgi:hypothetical protein